MTRYTTELQKIKSSPEHFLSFRFSRKTMRLISAEASHENIRMITRWRKKYSESFLTKFNITQENTKKWIINILEDPKRILFIISLDGEKIGHIGIHRYDTIERKADIDSVLRAVRSKEHRLMELVLRNIFVFMFTNLKLKKIQLRVFSDNYKAINLYERAGMITIKSLPLKKIKTSNGWKWTVIELSKKKLAQRYLNIMEIKRVDIKLR